jgi:hypothetical protein
MSSDTLETPGEQEGAATAASTPQTASPSLPPPAPPGALPPGYAYVPVRRDPKSPVAAVLLSILFPGLGQGYNGQVSKALMFFAVWASSLYAVIEVGPLPWVFVMIFTTLFSYVDAYRSAVLINARAAGSGVAEPDEVPDSPLWGGALLLLGVLLLLNNLGWLRLIELQRFWPVLLIVAGAVTLVNSLRRRQAREASGETDSQD